MYPEARFLVTWVLTAFQWGWGKSTTQLGNRAFGWVGGVSCIFLSSQVLVMLTS